MNSELEIRNKIVKKIRGLSAANAKEVSTILTEIKRLKGEGKTEMDREVVAKVIELEKLLGDSK